MQLKQICPVCDKKYHNALESIRANNSIPSELLDVTINAIPKPKAATIFSERAIGSKILVKYAPCNHTILHSKVEYERSQSGAFTSLTKGYKTFDYQTEGVKFALESDLNCLIADEMGLGKTAQSLVAIREALQHAETDITPIVITVKSATIYQWIREFKEWCTLDPLGILPISSAKHLFIPGFKAYIVSHDLLPDVVDKLIALKPKLIIGDEVQSFKNRESKRSKALVKLCTECQIQHKIFLSGTPFKNRAAEYFTVLNLLAPGHFRSFRDFIMRWLEANEKGIYTRIRPYALEDFRKLTSKWIIRRECADVQKDLPELRTTVTNITITDPLIKKSYNQQLDLFRNFTLHAGKINAIEILGWLAKLRRMTALAKLPETIESVKEFLDSNEHDKIAIGIHHKSVKDQLFYALEPYGALQLSGEDSAEQKDIIVQKFKTEQYRVLIINEVSGGTGLDGLQVCNNVFVLERQWSAADEDQFIKRFLRTGQTKPVWQNFLMADGTIDSQFHAWVQEKRAICGETYGNDYDLGSDTEGIREFADRVISQRL